MDLHVPCEQLLGRSSLGRKDRSAPYFVSKTALVAFKEHVNFIAQFFHTIQVGSGLALQLFVNQLGFAQLRRL